MSTKILKTLQQRSFFVMVLTAAVLFAATSAFADPNNTVNVYCGDPRADGSITLNIILRVPPSGGIGNVLLQWTTANILAADNAVDKATKIRAAAPANQYIVIPVGGALNVVSPTAKNGYEIKAAFFTDDSTWEPMAISGVGFIPPGHRRIVLSLSGTAASGGDVTVTVYGETATVDVNAGQTAAAIEDLIITEMVSLGLTGTRLATVYDNLASQFPGAEGDGRVILFSDVDDDGVAIDVNDTGLTLDVGGVIVIEGKLPAANTWGLIVMAMLLLSVGGFVLLKHKRTTATA